MPEFSKGLAGVGAAETQMSFIDGQQGVLEYVGIAIGDLASSSTFEEPHAVAISQPRLTSNTSHTFPLVAFAPFTTLRASLRMSP